MTIIEELKMPEAINTSSLDILEDRFLAKRNNRWYSITVVGIDFYEENLPPSVVRSRLAQRKKVLEILKESYQAEPNKQISNSELGDKAATFLHLHTN